MEAEQRERGELRERGHVADERVRVEVQLREEAQILNGGRHSAVEVARGEREAAQIGELADDRGELAGKRVARADELAQRGERGERGEDRDERLREAIVVHLQAGERGGGDDAERDDAGEIVVGDVKLAEARELREERGRERAGEVVGGENERGEVGQRENRNGARQLVGAEAQRHERRQRAERRRNCAADRIVAKVERREPGQPAHIGRQHQLRHTQPHAARLYGTH